MAVAAIVLAGCLDDGPGADEERASEDERTQQLRGLLWKSRTSRIDVVVHAQAGYEPAPTSVSAVEEQFTRLVDKPVRVIVRVEPYDFTDDKVWNYSSLEAVRAPAYAEPWPAGTALVHAFALPGCYRYSDERPCIAAISGRMATVFPRAAEGDMVPHDPLARDIPLYGWYHAERYLYVHELGHTFGLIDSPVPPVDGRISQTDCLCHSVDPDSVMGDNNRGWRARVPADDPSELVETFEDDSWQIYMFSDLDVADIRAFQALEPR